ncbi:MAG: homoserine dehydrogenase [bacterium]|nr:homoserine dehydrogenase [bacterium]
MDKINIGLIGLGTIGAGVVKIFQKNQALFKERLGVDLCLKRIVDIDLERKRDLDLSNINLSDDISEILNDEEINIIIELIGGYELARTYVLTALRKGKHVVTANKALLSKHWDEIIETAKESNVGVYFEASVCGGIPLILSITKGLSGNQILSINGILNGTCNYILSKMSSEKRKFKKVLIDAQKKGYAEADPSLDINGKDSAHKLAIISSLSFGQNISVEEIYVEGITEITLEDCMYAQEEFGCTIKLLAIGRIVDNKIDLRVHPTLIPKKHLLSKVEGAYNAVYVRGDNVGDLLFYGMGAGELPTASAVISDVAAIASKIKDSNTNFRSFLGQREKKKELLPTDELELKYYIRFSTVDHPGVLAKIAGILGDNNISIASVVQKEPLEENVAFVVMLTHKALEKNIRKALVEINKLKIIKAKSVLIRVEEME